MSKDGNQAGFVAIRPQDTIEFVSTSGPVAKRMTGRVVMRSPSIGGWVVNAGNESRPRLVDESNFVRIVRSARGRRKHAND